MLDERKQRILQAVIQDYISSAEPVGSRTLARKYDLGVSPATIRNEMADLEMLGYLEHIHTSSGRVPSSKGYRLYVDSPTNQSFVVWPDSALEELARVVSYSYWEKYDKKNTVIRLAASWATTQKAVEQLKKIL